MLWREKLEHVRAARREEGRVVGRAEGLAEGLAEREEMRREAMAKGRDEREQEMRRELMAWYERLEEARRDGRAFDEPPPYIDSNGRA